MISFQPSLRPALPIVLNNVDYNRNADILRRIDSLLIESGVENDFIARCDAQLEPDALVNAAEGWRERYQQHSGRALRCMILKVFLQLSYRKLSERLAESELCRWFVHLPDEGPIRVPTKSTLQDYASRLPEEELRLVIDTLLCSAMTPGEDGRAPFDLERELEMESVFLDSTCVLAPIHFPVDWVLLRDGVCTLMKAVALIRRHGLKHRMVEPGEFIGQINHLCMGMSAARRKKDGSKQRKKLLRSMKRVVKVVVEHARRYQSVLSQRWEETDWSRKQAQQVIDRIERIAGQMPAAIKQAHERIIGQRSVANGDKILSLYEENIHVIVRGKAGAEVEFGNKLLIAEQSDGLVVDWKLYEQSAPADTRTLPQSLERLFQAGGVQALCADRGFESVANRRQLEALGIYNAICPKNPRELAERMQEPCFSNMQKRRAQTEGRIGILKNQFLGRPLRAKGTQMRKEMVAWAVMTHNLWVLARLPQRKEQSEEDPPMQMAA